MEWNFESSAEALLETEERAARSHHVLTATLQRYRLSTGGPQEVLRARYEGLQVGRQHAALAATSVPPAVAVRAQGGRERPNRRPPVAGEVRSGSAVLRE